ncbi:MAG: anaerobic sulfatase maturase [Lachnospiraceae bacterium]|nr:anaerobic sulfatase maturase [Lachnospiraceae bacterium]MDD6303047.1 anaerobic sulfatase maturase [Lachnospiraceae bacterium]HCJ77119.1 anaerobic sulfatase maturase [Roseburia sp.]
MPAISILVKPASARCNLACKYCFYHSIADSRKVPENELMSNEGAENLVREAIKYATGRLCFAFQGGEPTLAGLSFFQNFVALERKYNTKGLVIENTIQTNGTLIDDEWAQFLAREEFLVGLSLDGPRAMNDYCRINYAGESIFDSIMQTVSLFKKYGVSFNVVSVVTAKTVEKVDGIYRFFQRKGFRYMQFIPCLDETNNGIGDYLLTPEAYGEFLCRLFDLWYEDFMTDRQTEIRMFSNLVKMSAGYAPEECGMCGRCNTYMVVESNGDVYPCDFYTRDEWKLGTVSDGFDKLYRSKKSVQFMKSSSVVQPECKRCEYFSLCRGGCRRWRDMEYNGNLQVNYLCSGYKSFFAYAGKRILQLGKMIL